MNNTYTELISFNQLNTRKMLVYLVYMHIYILKRNHFKNKRIVFQPSCLQGELWFRFWAYPVILDSRWGRNHCQRAMVLSLKWWKCVMFEGMQPYLGGWTTQITTWWQTCVKNDQMQINANFFPQKYSPGLPDEYPAQVKSVVWCPVMTPLQLQWLGSLGEDLF